MHAEDLPSSLRSHYAPLRCPPVADRPVHVILATTGSVASIKARDIVLALLGHANVRVFLLLTATSKHFVDVAGLQREAQSLTGDVHAKSAPPSQPYTVHHLAEENERGFDAVASGTPRLVIWDDQQDWAHWKEVGDPILHIELRRWADIVLVAPCSANTLAKLHAGLCDNLLTNMLRATSPSTPVYLFPAMNTLMFAHPFTAVHLTSARDILGYQIVGPISKRLACGDYGQGAMKEWTDIVQIVVQRFGLQGAELSGLSVAAALSTSS